MFKIVKYPYELYLKWYRKRYSKQIKMFRYSTTCIHHLDYNPFTIFQFYLIGLTITTITIGLSILIILMIQSLT